MVVVAFGSRALASISLVRDAEAFVGCTDQRGRGGVHAQRLDGDQAVDVTGEAANDVLGAGSGGDCVVEPVLTGERSGFGDRNQLVLEFGQFLVDLGLVDTRLAGGNQLGLDFGNHVDGRIHTV